MAERKKAFWFITILSILVLVPFLGETLFYSKGEPREAIVAFSMIESGNWILPISYGSDIAYKPPFFQWIIASVSLLTGGINEFTSRFPSTLAFIAMQLVFFCFVAKRLNVKSAVVSALLLLTSFEVHRAAVACRVDMVQVSLIVISLCLLFRWDERGCHRVPWAAILLMGCATLTKGPVGSIFPCACIGIYQLLRGRTFLKVLFSLIGIGLLTFIPYALWIAAAYAQGGSSFLELMIEENFGRFTGTMSYESHYNPMWYNFLTIIWGWVPWTLVLLLSLFGLKRNRMQTAASGGGRTGWKQRLHEGWNRFRALPPLQLFTWVVIVFIFVFYCIPKSKRSVYLLPIYPFMALLIAQYLLALAEKGAKVFRISGWIFASLCLLLTAAFGIVRCGLFPENILGNGRHAAENAAFVQALEQVTLSTGKWLIVALPLIAGICMIRALLKKADAKALLYGIAGCMLCIFVALDGVYQPTVLTVKSDIRLAQCFSRFVPEGPIYSYINRLDRFYGANFYLKDRMRNFVVELPEGEGYVMLPVDVEKNFLDEFSGSYQLEKVYHTPYRSCDLRREVLVYAFKKEHISVSLKLGRIKN